MRVAVDAMGGDNAPYVVVAGALQAVKDLPELKELLLVGDEDALKKELKALTSKIPETIQIVHASEVVGMDEAPASAIRRKKDSSISRAVELVKNGKADALFSAGNTGAVVAATSLKLRTLNGVMRPAIAMAMPTTSDNPVVVVDVGANTDCGAEQLWQFAVMGTVYAREILGISKPQVGLLSIGGEDAKGNDMTKEAFSLLEKSKMNFTGNVESEDLFEGRVDVVVCDGFVGNVVLKTCESVAHAFSHWLKSELTANPLRILGALLCKGALKTMKKRTDPAIYGGAPLLGINGACIIGHGSSTAFAVSNAIRGASDWIRHDINCLIEHDIKVSKTSTEGEQS